MLPSSWLWWWSLPLPLDTGWQARWPRWVRRRGRDGQAATEPIRTLIVVISAITTSTTPARGEPKNSLLTAW